MKIFSLIFCIASLGLTACSGLTTRSESSGYAYRDDLSPTTADQYYSEKKRHAWSQAKEELGYVTTQELNEAQAQSIRTRTELNRLEKNLSNEADKAQYYSYKPYFRSDAERVQFLKLPSKEIRERWARGRGLATEETTFSPAINQLIENSDIAKGMSKNAVRQSWGEPEFVEVAGNPIYGNERWRYNKLVSSEEGYKQETRLIYFEAGRVVGWETL
jgi:hypothetical protein